MIDTEVGNAESFKPPLTTLYIATTAETDKTIQAFVRTLSEKRKAAGGFNVEFCFGTTCGTISPSMSGVYISIFRI